eukprot:TRINITY_DN12383_c0_g1_i4.p2 TRINITY_DN12383_c0_g1~~TRINITY_DN12383_c0_g1_i4.p2  ORF type:complete len:103 (-),score=24.75 TRINITY_DN12383_c0_g1_i4:301-609(-)
MHTQYRSSGGGRIKGKPYSKAQCYERCLQLKPDYALAWSNLGVEGGGTIVTMQVLGTISENKEEGPFMESSTQQRSAMSDASSSSLTMQVLGTISDTPSAVL